MARAASEEKAKTTSTEGAPAQTPRKGKRGSQAVKTYVQADGTEGRSATPEAQAVKFNFADGGEPVVISPNDLPRNIQVCAMFHGISQKLGDSYAGSDDPRESFDAMLERLKAGEWVTTAKAEGPRVSLLVEAISNALRKAGKPVDEARIRERVKDKTGRDRALANPVIAAEYEAIRAARAQEKAAKAAAAAKGAHLEAF